jgi:prepilin-type N-terminal cleavage/methylation domain-containing protein/prepilin-type processing-associated H-X9-DG protein
MKNPSRNRGGLARDQIAFTLIELLVVIAIIGILASMLLPVLSAAKDRAYRATCEANIHQMGLANHMYTDDNADYFAWPNWGTTYAGWLWTSGNFPPIPAASVANAQVNWGAAQQYYVQGLWFKYMPNSKTYVCPMDAKDPTFNDRPDWMCSYVMNGAPMDYGKVNAGSTCKITQVWSQGCYLMWEPCVVWNDIQPAPSPGSELSEFNDASSFPGQAPGGEYEGVGILHSKKGGNILAIDGHVEFVTTNQFKKESLATVDSFLWWAPQSVDGH